MLDVDARHHDLLFLLGLAPLALGCAVGVPDDGPQFTSASPGTPPGGEEGSTEDAASGGTGSGGGSSGQNTIGDPDEGVSASASASMSASADDGSTSSASADASVSVSVSVGEDEVTTNDTAGPPPGSSPCEGYAYVIAACYYGGDPTVAMMYTENCEYGLYYFGAVYGPACAAAFEDTRACISQLSCPELALYGMGVCDAEQAAFEAACP